MNINDVPNEFIINQLTEKQKIDIIIKFLISETRQEKGEKKTNYFRRLANIFNYSPRTIERLVYKTKKPV